MNEFYKVFKMMLGLPLAAEQDIEPLLSTYKRVIGTMVGHKVEIPQHFKIFPRMFEVEQLRELAHNDGVMENTIRHQMVEGFREAMRDMDVPGASMDVKVIGGSMRRRETIHDVVDAIETYTIEILLRIPGRSPLWHRAVAAISRLDAYRPSEDGAEVKKPTAPRPEETAVRTRMSVLDTAVKTDFEYNEYAALINAVIYKLSSKLGKQVVSERFVDLLEAEENGHTSPASVPDLEPSLETGMIALATRIQQALEKQYATEWKDVKVSVILARWMAACDGTIKPYVGLRVSIEAEDAHLVHYHADLAILDDPYIPVDVCRLPSPDSATADEPIYYLGMAAIKDLCLVDVVDNDVLESLSIAAMAIGWNDTESYGKTMILVG